MTASPLEAVGLLVACGGTAAAISAPGRRWRWIALTVALAAALALLAGDVWDDPRFADLRSSPALIGAGALLLAVVIPTAVWAFRRWRWAFPVLAFAVLALRLPMRIAGETSSLLVPLYLVIAAGLASALWEEFGPGATPPRALRPEPRPVVWLRRLLAAALVVYALQALYSADVSNAIENVCFFLAPFGALFMLLADVRWSERLLASAAIAIAAIAVGYALVAFAEYASRDLILNSELLKSNQIKPFFRVNSVFHDPNVLGRYLALVIIVLGAGVAWSRGGGWAALATATGLVLLAALVLTFSITSFIALLIGLIVLAGLRHGLWGAAAAAAATVAVAAAFFALGGAGGDDNGPERGINKVTSGRVGLVEGGLELAEDRPLLGWGSGAFGRAYFDQIRETETTTSHSEPLTVAAEQGVVGLALYVALLGSMLRVMFGAGVRSSAARSAVAACMVA
ncbi:MAG: O-antigen ligase family protein, partial [bacterium]